jgi:hypothetical protein
MSGINRVELKEREDKANARCWNERMYSANCCCKTCPNHTRCDGSDADDDNPTPSVCDRK